MDIRDIYKILDERKFVDDPYKIKKAKRRQRRIDQYFDEDLRKFLLDLVNNDYDCDNKIKSANVVADLIREALRPLGFKEIGVGSNRIVFLKDGYAFKIAMDRRGTIDNLSEYLRSVEEPQFLAKVYETNRLIAVSEYARLMSYDEFKENEDKIRVILNHLSMRYIIQDLGLIPKNFCNLGFRSNGDIIFIDYAYMYKIAGHEKEIYCSVCGAELAPNKNFTGYVCTDKRCGTKYLTYEVLNMMDRDTDDCDDKEVIQMIGADDQSTDSSNFTFVKISGDDTGETEFISEEDAIKVADEIKKQKEREDAYLKEIKNKENESKLDFDELDISEKPQKAIEVKYETDSIDMITEDEFGKLKELYNKVGGGAL